MKHHWDNSCFKTNKHIEAVLKRPAHLLASSKSEILREKFSDQRGVLYSEKITPDSLFSEQMGKIFISSLYAKQNNLLPSINHLNQLVLRLRDGTKVTIV